MLRLKNIMFKVASSEVMGEEVTGAFNGLLR